MIFKHCAFMHLGYPKIIVNFLENNVSSLRGSLKRK